MLASTNLNLSELYKLKNQSKRTKFVEEHTYNNLTVIDTVTSEPDLENSETFTVTICDIPDKLQEPEPVIPICDTEDPEAGLEKVQHPLQPEVFEESEDFDTTLEIDSKTLKSSNKNPKTLDQKVKYQIAVKTLASYLEVCSNLKQPMKGLNALLFHNHRSQRCVDKNFQAIKDIKVYNALLKGFASQGDVCHLEEVIKLIRNEKIQLTQQSYVAILECYGRTNVKDHYLKQIRIYAKEALVNGFSFDKLLNEAIFLNDEREIVLAAMQRADPHYQPTYFPPNVQYNNHLVNSLNCDEQVCPPEKTELTQGYGVFTPEFLNTAIQQQIDLEKIGSVTVSTKNIGSLSIKNLIVYIRYSS